MSVKTAVVIGAGDRGARAYASYAYDYPHELRIAVVAEPNQKRRERFSMCGFTRDQTRRVQIMGTKGEIRGDMQENELSIYDFLTKQETIMRFDTPKADMAAAIMPLLGRS